VDRLLQQPPAALLDPAEAEGRYYASRETAEVVEIQ
jgi:hypothetical protein